METTNPYSRPVYDPPTRFSVAADDANAVLADIRIPRIGEYVPSRGFLVAVNVCPSAISRGLFLVDLVYDNAERSPVITACGDHYFIN